ncbi:hypothetical protein [Acidithiobacillus ferridurans]|uniref:hypothetical protein n=1 Tax=Acidithiobacillus ferridurans TaxID=1232575 RepID=UPI0011BFD4A2|nr:hypothetical protein [Acidithiobacillus ferridurans]
MVKLALRNAAEHGIAGDNTLLPLMKKRGGSGREEIVGTTGQQIVPAADSPATAPITSAVAPENMSREELVAFTVANLPPDTPPHLVELAKQYSSRTPYTMERLQMLYELQGAGADADPASTST